MNALRSVAHLQRELGDDLFDVLISSDNTRAVCEFAESLIKEVPTQMTIGGRTYDILDFLRRGEESVSGNTMVNRVKEMQANPYDEDGQHILENQEEIPVALRGKVVFIFAEWHPFDSPRAVASIGWDSFRWVQRWRGLNHEFVGCDRVLRRKS